MFVYVQVCSYTPGCYLLFSLSPSLCRCRVCLWTWRCWPSPCRNCPFMSGFNWIPSLCRQVNISSAQRCPPSHLIRRSDSELLKQRRFIMVSTAALCSGLTEVCGMTSISSFFFFPLSIGSHAGRTAFCNHGEQTRHQHARRRGL